MKATLKLDDPSKEAKYTVTITAARWEWEKILGTLRGGERDEWSQPAESFASIVRELLGLAKVEFEAEREVEP